MSYIRFVYLFLLSKSFISLSPSFFNSYIRFVYLFLPFRDVHFVLLLSFRFIVLHPLRLPPFLSACQFHHVRPFVATLPFDSLLLSFRFNSFESGSLLLSLSFQLFASVPYTLYLVPFVLNSSLPFVTSFPSFQRFHPVHMYLFFSFHGVHFVTSSAFASMFPSRSFTSSFRFKPFTSLPPFASTLLSCSSCSSLPSFPVNSSISLHPSFRCNSSLPFVWNSSSGSNSSSQFVFGREKVVFGQFVFAIRLREGSRLRAICLRNSSSGGEFLFGTQFVFGEFVFGIRLRGVIRLRDAIRLRGIRLRNPSPWGN